MFIAGKRYAMLKMLVFIVASLICLTGFSKEIKAASQDACAIWLCLPAGFSPQECSGAYSEFRSRIKRGRPPLPDLSGCTTGPNSETVSGSYQLGIERFQPCEDGYVLRENEERNSEAMCYLERCAPEGFGGDDNSCRSYQAALRPKPSYVKMWVGGQYLGQFFY